MSKYTTTIKTVLKTKCEQECLYNGLEEECKNCYNMCAEDLIEIEAVRRIVFRQKWPFYTDNEQERENFEKMFLLYYYEYYIGFETFMMFRNRLMAKLMVLMPEYKALYNEMTKDYDWLNPVDMKHQRTDIGRDLANMLSEKSGLNITDTINDGNSQTNNTRTGNATSSGSTNTLATGSTNDTGVTDTNGTTHSETSGTSNTTTNNSTSVTGSTTGSSETSSNLHDTENTESTTNVSDNSQSIHSDNPQINFGGNDYASTMERGQETTNTNGSVDFTKNQTESSSTTTSEDKTESTQLNGSSNRTDNGTTDGTTQSKESYTKNGKTENSTTQNTTGSSNTNDTGTENSTNHATGKSTNNQQEKVQSENQLDKRNDSEWSYNGTNGTGRYKLLAEYAEMVVNLNQRLIEDLRPLFLGVW